MKATRRDENPQHIHENCLDYEKDKSCQHR